jgi:hypothetical protein
MRAIRTWGSVRGVPGNWHPYRDQRRDATRALTQRPEWRGGASRPKREHTFWRKTRYIPGVWGRASERT